MIFVTYGTQPHNFEYLSELVNEIDQKYEVVVQIGNSKNIIKRPNTRVFEFDDNYMNYVKQADIVITHSGVGSIISALEQEKKVIAISRLAKFNEHIDDHQLEIANKLENENYIVHFDRASSINETIDFVKNSSFKKYISNTPKFGLSLKKLIEEMYD